MKIDRKTRKSIEKQENQQELKNINQTNKMLKKINLSCNFLGVYYSRAS